MISTEKSKSKHPLPNSSREKGEGSAEMPTPGLLSEGLLDRDGGQNPKPVSEHPTTKIDSKMGEFTTY